MYSYSLVVDILHKISTVVKLRIKATKTVLETRLIVSALQNRDFRYGCAKLFKYKLLSEAAPASTEGRGQAHEGRQKGAWLTIL